MDDDVGSGGYRDSGGWCKRKWRVVDEQVVCFWIMVVWINERERVVGKAAIWVVDLKRELGKEAALVDFDLLIDLEIVGFGL